MFMTKDSVTDVAEEMLNTANELTGIHQSLDEMDTILSSFEQDINTTNTSDNKNWTDTVLSHNLDHNTLQNYKNMKHAAENVRHATTAALSIITSTENVIDSNKQEMDCLATSTPRGSDDSRVSKKDDRENNNLLLTTSSELNYGINSDNKTFNRGDNSERELSPLTDNIQRSEVVIKPSGDKIKSVHKTDSSLDMPEGMTVINKETNNVNSVQCSDINYNNTHKQQRWKWDISSSYPPPPPEFGPEKTLENAEDQIYMAAGTVFELEDRVNNLQNKVQSTGIGEKRKMSDLEDEVARTVAHVHQSEKDVSSIERSVGQLHVSAPTSPRSSAWEDNSSNLSSPSLSIDSGFSSIREKPLQTVIFGTTSEEEMPESRTEVNEETGVELPSVSRLKAMFGHGKNQEDDSSLKRIHSITARSLGKEKLEQIRRNAIQNSSGPVRPQGDSHLTVNLTPTPGGTKHIDQDPTQVFPEDQGSLFPESKTVIPSKPPRQNQPINTAVSISHNESHPMKTTVTSVKKIHAPAPPVSKSVVTQEQSQPMKASITKIQRSDTPVNSPSQPSQQLHMTSESIVSEHKEEKRTPKIRTGCISARAAFWEKRIHEEEVNEEEFPEMVEDAIPE